MLRAKLLRPGALLTLTLMAVACLSPAAAAETGEAVFRAEGRGVILKGDRAPARKKAIETALEEALESAAEELLGKAVPLSAAPALEAEVIASKENYIFGYRIVEEGALLGGRIWRVELEARVDLRALGEALSGIPGLEFPPPEPQVLVLVEEHHLGLGPKAAPPKEQGAGRRLSEGALISRLSQAGITCLDSQSIWGRGNDRLARQALGGSNEAALTLGKNLGVPLVLLGSATVQQGGGPAEFQAIITARLLRVATGEVLALHTIGVTVTHRERGLALALEEAGAAMAERLGPEITEELGLEPGAKKRRGRLFARGREGAKILRVKGNSNNQIHRRRFLP